MCNNFPERGDSVTVVGDTAGSARDLGGGMQLSASKTSPKCKTPDSSQLDQGTGVAKIENYGTLFPHSSY